MDRALEGHRRYLAALREACSRHPRAHAHQLAALDREISLAAAAGDDVSFRAGGADLFELTRAAWLDRAANHAHVAVAVGDPWQAEAAAVEHAEALAATGHEDWNNRLAAAGARSASLRERSAEARSAFTGLLLCLLGLHSTGSDFERATCRDQAVGAYRALREADPAFAWGEGPEQPRYRWRTPWTGPGLALVGGWIAELDSGAGAVAGEADDPLAAIRSGQQRWQRGLADRPPGRGTGEPPAVADVVAPYAELAAALSGDDRLSAATRRAAEAVSAAGSAEPTGQAALARFVEEGLLTALSAAPLRARAEDGLARQSVWPDPLVEHHWRTLLATLDRARTETDVELISVHAEACFAIEADWNAALLGSLLGPLRAACTYGWEGSEASRAGVARAARTSHALLGLSPRRLLAVPRVAEFVARILVPLAADGSGAGAAFQGEAGFDLLGETEAWLEFVRDHGGETPRDAAGLSAALLGLLDRAGADEPASQPRPVALWDAGIEPDDVAGALARPRRPPIPGLEPVGDAGSGL